jgi:hypothetical protein
VKHSRGGSTLSRVTWILALYIWHCCISESKGVGFWADFWQKSAFIAPPNAFSYAALSLNTKHLLGDASPTTPAAARVHLVLSWVQRGPKVTPLVARQMRATFAWLRGCDVNLAHMSRKCYTRKFRVRCASARVSCKCCAHLPREERATRDVTFGPLCTKQMS